MRPLILALVPVVLFLGALVSVSAPAADQPQHPLYQPASAPAVQENATIVQQPAQPPPQAAPEAPAQVQQPPPQKQVVYVQVRKCTGGGVTAYIYGDTTQIQPIESQRAQCDGPVAVVTGGMRYFGCPSGKVILDCDWFAEKIGQENQGSSAAFGSSSLEDFTAPDISGFSCVDSSVDQDLLLRPSGKICDLQTLVGNVGQAGG